jgi:hypothetical protein
VELIKFDLDQDLSSADDSEIEVELRRKVSGRFVTFSKLALDKSSLVEDPKLTPKVATTKEMRRSGSSMAGDLVFEPKSESTSRRRSDSVSGTPMPMAQDPITTTRRSNEKYRHLNVDSRGQIWDQPTPTEPAPKPVNTRSGPGSVPVCPGPNPVKLGLARWKLARTKHELL